MSPVLFIGRGAVKLVGAKSRAFLVALAGVPTGSVDIVASVAKD